MAASEPDSCKVRGTMALVLRVSRIHGVAAVSLESDGDTYIARVSYPAIWYCRSLFIGIVIIMSVGLALELPYYGTDKTFNFDTLFNSFLYLCEVGMTLNAIGFGVYGIKDRMKRMMRYLKEIEKVHEVTCSELSFQSTCGSLDVGIIGLLSVFYATWLADLGFHIRDNYTNNTKMIIACITAFHYTHYILIMLLVIQFTFVVFEIDSGFKATNNGLLKLIHYHDLKAQNPISVIRQSSTFVSTIDSEEMAGSFGSDKASFEDLSDAYMLLCNVVKTFNEENGLIIVVLLGTSVANLLLTIYIFVAAMCLSEYGWVIQLTICILQSAWFLWQFITIAMLIESCHRVNVEIRETQVLLCKLMYRVTNAGDPIPTRLDTLQKLLVLYKPTISPMNACALHRNHIAAIMGALITYVTFIVQNRVVFECNP